VRFGLSARSVERPDRAPAAHQQAATAARVRRRRPVPILPEALDDWPRTTRVLPWMIAGFLVMLWLIPFDTISMTVNLPFELKLDRIYLPFVVVVWCIALAVGGRGAPRLRLTAIHVAVGTYVSVAFLSVILHIDWLNRQLLVQTSLKQLVLLSSYATLFLIVSSSVRKSEVRAFVNFTLILAVLCGLGSLYEYRAHYDVFYQWSRMLFPSGIFDVPIPPASAIDELGRRVTLGPAEAALELATMLSLAVPIAFVGIMQAVRRRNRVLYAVAACILLAGGLTTFRKSSLIMPAVAVVILMAFKPRQVVRLAPLAVVLFVVVHILAPGAIGGVTGQLTSSQLTSVGTTAHRTSGFDAIRPFVWTHPAFGQGYGSYNANLYRILDSQILMTTIETGVIGLVAYLSMMLTTLFSARRLFRHPDPQWGRVALGLGVSAMVFFTSSFLFDTMAFPHGPYIFLTLAAFVAVMVRRDEDPEASPVAHIGAPTRRVRRDEHNGRRSRLRSVRIPRRAGA
jgi:hypothetical protein